MSVFKKTTEPRAGKKKPILAIKPPPIPLQKYLDKAYREAVAAGPQLGPQTKDALGRERHLAISIIAHAGGFLFYEPAFCWFLNDLPQLRLRR